MLRGIIKHYLQYVSVLDRRELRGGYLLAHKK
jgi:hypothetical protein